MIKAILKSFDLMQNFDSILTYKIYQNKLLNSETNISTRLIMLQDPEKKIGFILTVAGPSDYVLRTSFSFVTSSVLNDSIHNLFTMKVQLFFSYRFSVVM